MQTINLHCSSSQHATNAAQAGWNDGVLGTQELADGAAVPPGSLICPGCSYQAQTSGAAQAFAAFVQTVNADLVAALAATNLTTNQQATIENAVKNWVLKHWGVQL